jgi:hypothetical protein
MPVLLGWPSFEFFMFSYSGLSKGTHFGPLGEIQSSVKTALKGLPVKDL